MVPWETHIAAPYLLSRSSSQQKPGSDSRLETLWPGMTSTDVREIAHSARAEKHGLRADGASKGLGMVLGDTAEQEEDSRSWSLLRSPDGVEVVCSIDL